MVVYIATDIRQRTSNKERDKHNLYVDNNFLSCFLEFYWMYLEAITLESFGFSRCWWLNVLHAAHSLPSCHVSHILLLLSANCLAHFIVFMHASLIWVEDLTLVICEKHNPWKKPKYIWLVTHHSSQSNNIYILLCLIAWKVIGSNEVRNNGFSTRILGGRKETFRLQ